jgi:Aspartyl/Asparaginyl beta-hydroxylase
MKHWLEPGRKPRMLEITQHPIDVSQALEQLDANPDLWNAYSLRTKGKTPYSMNPHGHVDDIWVRYNAWEHYDPKKPKGFFKEHDSSWYPAYGKLPALRPLIFGLMQVVEGVRLGGVLITRIPAGSSVAPHIDVGWHAGYYRKFAVQLRGGPKQLFCFEGESLEAESGEVYEFDNSEKHWVQNDSDRERMTLIVCIRAGA